MNDSTQLPGALVVGELVTAAVDEAAPVLTITVYGEAGPQGSKRHVGNGRMIESSALVTPWRDAVVWMARHARNRVRGWRTLTGPVAVSMVFSMARPQGDYGTGRNAGTLRPSARARPHVIPDISKLARSTEDALTTAAIYKDDALIVEYRRLAKHYVTDHGTVPDVLPRPGCVIRLYPLGGGEGA